MSTLNVAGKLYLVTFNFFLLYFMYIMYTICFVKLQIHASWKTKLTV